MIWWSDLLSNCQSNGPCLVKNGWVDPEIFTILVIEVGQNILPSFYSRNGTTFNKFLSSFQAISQQHSGIKRWFLRQNILLNMVITATPTMACNNDNCNFRYLGTSISPPIVLYWKFFLQVLAMLQITHFWRFFVLFGMRKWMVVVSTQKE